MRWRNSPEDDCVEELVNSKRKVFGYISTYRDRLSGYNIQGTGSRFIGSENLRSGYGILKKEDVRGKLKKKIEELVK